MTACQVVFNMSGCGGGSGTEYLIDGAQNTWAQLRIINASANLAYVEFRDIKAPLARASTNWTEVGVGGYLGQRGGAHGGQQGGAHGGQQGGTQEGSNNPFAASLARLHTPATPPTHPTTAL